MSSLRTLRRRIEKIEHNRKPPPSSVPPFYVIDKQPQAEIDRIRREVEDWERAHPAGPPGLIITFAHFDADD